MLLSTSGNARWRRWAWWALVFLVVSYIWYGSREYPHGGSSIGLLYGTVGLVIILVLVYFGVRKRSYMSLLSRILIYFGVLRHPDKDVEGTLKTWLHSHIGRSPWGKLETWLHSHIYLGLLVLVIILFHSGFRFHDKVAVSALILLTFVVLSGLVGAILYTIVPPKLSEVESDLSAGEISDQINQVAQKMARFASGRSDALQKIYTGLVQAERPGTMARWRIMSGRYLRERIAKNSIGSFQDYQGRVGPDEHSDLSQLLVLAQQMRALNSRLIHKQRYINIMTVWMYLHVPLSFAMMLAIVAHVSAFFYYW